MTHFCAKFPLVEIHTMLHLCNRTVNFRPVAIFVTVNIILLQTCLWSSSTQYFTRPHQYFII